MRILVVATREGDVTNWKAPHITQLNPYYLLVAGKPLPIALLEEGEIGQVARDWFKRWRNASTKEQIEFCGAGLFWAP